MLKYEIVYYYNRPGYRIQHFLFEVQFKDNLRPLYHIEKKSTKTLQLKWRIKTITACVPSMFTFAFNQRINSRTSVKISHLLSHINAITIFILRKKLNWIPSDVSSVQVHNFDCSFRNLPHYCQICKKVRAQHKKII